MSEHIPVNHDSAPLNDVEMEDFSEITNALVAAIPKNEPDNAGEGVQVRDFAHSLAATAPTTDGEQDASDSMHDVADATPPTQATVPTRSNDTADRPAVPAQYSDPDAEDEAANLRYELFFNMFINQAIDLKDLTPPKECAQYPEHANEVIEAYLEHTTIIVKIWTNFDVADQVFFEGDRAAGCGKLQVPKKKLDWLLGLDQHCYNFDHVRLDVGTPFRTLAKVFLDVRYRDGEVYLEVRGTMVKQYPPRGMSTFRDFLGTRIQMISRARADRSLDMDDLVNIASIFRRRRLVYEDDVDWEEPAYEGGQWAGIEEPHSLLQNSSSRWAVE